MGDGSTVVMADGTRYLVSEAPTFAVQQMLSYIRSSGRSDFGAELAQIRLEIELIIREKGL